MADIIEIECWNDIIKASELLDRINAQFDEQGFVPPGQAPYQPRHFMASLYEDLTSGKSNAWLSENVFLWARIVHMPHNRRVRVAVEQMFLVDWERSQQEGMAMLLHFQKWADEQGCTMAYVTIQPAGDPRKEKYMRRLGFTPYETIFAVDLRAPEERPNPHAGSTLKSFLQEEGIYEETREAALKKLAEETRRGGHDTEDRKLIDISCAGPSDSGKGCDNPVTHFLRQESLPLVHFCTEHAYSGCEPIKPG